MERPSLGAREVEVEVAEEIEVHLFNGWRRGEGAGFQEG